MSLTFFNLIHQKTALSSQVSRSRCLLPVRSGDCSLKHTHRRTDYKELVKDTHTHTHFLFLYYHRGEPKLDTILHTLALNANILERLLQVTYSKHMKSGLGF